MIDAGGGEGNQEYINPMYCLLEKVKEQVAKTGHLNNKGKICHMIAESVGWEDILEKADDLYSGMATPGNVRWPPALNA